MDAWWPTGGGLDKPKGASLARPVDTHDPDHVPGSTYDLGVGDHRSRAAVQESAGRLAVVEARLASAVLDAGVRARQPALVKPTPTSGSDHLVRAVASCRWRTAALAEDGLLVTPAGLRAVRIHLRPAATESARVSRLLGRALGRGSTGGIAHAEPKCRICGIRPRAERSGPNGTTRASEGGRCHTCAQWCQRNRGQERPRSFDEDAVGDALAAAARRRTRGEGWGAA